MVIKDARDDNAMQMSDPQDAAVVLRPNLGEDKEAPKNQPLEDEAGRTDWQRR